MSPKVEVVLKNVTSTQGEGPHWEGDTQTLVFVDIMAGNVLKYHPGTGQQSKVHVGAPVGFVVPRKKGGYVIAAGRSLSLLDWDKQTVTSLGEVDVGSGNRINDGKCDASGRLWAGTMGPPVEPASTRPNYIPKRGSLYSLDLGGKITKKIKEVTLSNGLTWSENNKTMFYIDSPTRRVDMFDFDLETGDLANRRVCVDFDTFPVFRGSPPSFPDGMTVDNQGKLWVACYFGSCVARFDPETGSMLQTVEIPNAERVTSVCWGGSNLDQLYVTTSRRGVTDEEFATTQGLAGSLFRVTGLGCKGLPASVYEG
ncbi:regucalcin-like [Haliotis cracherodii]|uniref:regucalcin-like n=1 Tax=Haliotis cracherodii TaxID=6455 RepID=UPI0039EA3863